MIDAVDQSWGFIDPAAAKAAGIRVVAGYLSHDPSKNWTADKIRQYHAVGIGVILNWESEPGRPLLGGAAGRADALEAKRQADALVAAVGRPSSQLSIIFSCDKDVSAADYPQIETYFREVGTVLAGAYRVGVYGEADVVSHLHSLNLTQTEWQTVAWSHGILSPDADLYQYQINAVVAGASVDLDRLIHQADLGAWWPDGLAPASLEATLITNRTPEDTMAIVVRKPDSKGRGGMIASLDSAFRKRGFTAANWRAVRAVIAKLPKEQRPPIIQLNAADFNDLPDGK